MFVLREIVVIFSCLAIDKLRLCLNQILKVSLIIFGVFGKVFFPRIANIDQSIQGHSPSKWSKLSVFLLFQRVNSFPRRRNLPVLHFGKKPQRVACCPIRARKILWSFLKDEFHCF